MSLSIASVGAALKSGTDLLTRRTATSSCERSSPLTPEKTHVFPSEMKGCQPGKEWPAGATPRRIGRSSVRAPCDASLPGEVVPSAALNIVSKDPMYANAWLVLSDSDEEGAAVPMRSALHGFHSLNGGSAWILPYASAVARGVNSQRADPSHERTSDEPNSLQLRRRRAARGLGRSGSCRRDHTPRLHGDAFLSPADASVHSGEASRHPPSVGGLGIQSLLDLPFTHVVLRAQRRDDHDGTAVPNRPLPQGAHRAEDRYAPAEAMPLSLEAMKNCHSDRSDASSIMETDKTHGEAASTYAEGPLVVSPLSTKAFNKPLPSRAVARKIFCDTVEAVWHENQRHEGHTDGSLPSHGLPFFVSDAGETSRREELTEVVDLPDRTSAISNATTMGFMSAFLSHPCEDCDNDAVPPRSHHHHHHHHHRGRGGPFDDTDDDDSEMHDFRTPLSPCPSSTAPHYNVLLSQSSPLTGSARSRKFNRCGAPAASTVASSAQSFSVPSSCLPKASVTTPQLSTLTETAAVSHRGFSTAKDNAHRGTWMRQATPSACHEDVFKTSNSTDLAEQITRAPSLLSLRHLRVSEAEAVMRSTSPTAQHSSTEANPSPQPNHTVCATGLPEVNANLSKVWTLAQHCTPLAAEPLPKSRSFEQSTSGSVICFHARSDSQPDTTGSVQSASLSGSVPATVGSPTAMSEKEGDRGAAVSVSPPLRKADGITHRVRTPFISQFHGIVGASEDVSVFSESATHMAHASHPLMTSHTDFCSGSAAAPVRVPVRPFFGYTTAQGCRNHQEDSVIIHTEIPLPTAKGSGVPGGAYKLFDAEEDALSAVEEEDPRLLSCFGVFDGHNGGDVSMRASQYFLEHFLFTYRQQCARLHPSGGEGDGSPLERTMSTVCSRGELIDRDHRILSSVLVQTLMHMDVTLHDTLRTESGSTACIAACYVPSMPGLPSSDLRGAASVSSTEDEGPEVPLVVAASHAGPLPTPARTLSGAERPVVREPPSVQTPSRRDAARAVDGDGEESADFLCLSIANLGDSRAVLGSLSTGGVLLQTVDHRIASYPSEAARITACGGPLEMDRVDGALDVTRGLGDYRFKNPPSTWWRWPHPAEGPPPTTPTATSGDDGGGDAPFLQYTANVISNVADVYECVVHANDFLVIASDGVWDRMTSEEVVSFIARELRTEAAAIGVPILEVVPPTAATPSLGDGKSSETPAMSNSTPQRWASASAVPRAATDTSPYRNRCCQAVHSTPLTREAPPVSGPGAGPLCEALLPPAFIVLESPTALQHQHSRPPSVGLATRSMPSFATPKATFASPGSSNACGSCSMSGDLPPHALLPQTTASLARSITRAPLPPFTLAPLTHYASSILNSPLNRSESVDRNPLSALLRRVANRLADHVLHSRNSGDNVTVIVVLFTTADDR